jgi:hypothetical protein
MVNPDKLATPSCAVADELPDSVAEGDPGAIVKDTVADEVVKGLPN